MKIIEFRPCEMFFKKPVKLTKIYNIEVNIREDVKFVVVDNTGVIYGFINKPIYKGHWKSGKEDPFPIATATFEGDVKESLIKI